MHLVVILAVNRDMFFGVSARRSYSCFTENDDKSNDSCQSSSVSEAVACPQAILEHLERWPRLQEVPLRLRWATALRVLAHTLEYARVRSSRLEYARVLYARVRSSTLEYARVRSSTLEYARVRSSTLEYARVRSSTLEYARVRSSTLE